MSAHVAGPVTRYHDGWRVGCSCRTWLSMPYQTPQTPLVAFKEHVEDIERAASERRFLTAMMILVVIFAGFTLGLWL